MALTINQQPLYGFTSFQSGLPVGQQLIFSVLDLNAVSTYFNVKYRAHVFVYTTTPTTADVIGEFETTPNGSGAGIFDFKPVLETFVSPDYIAPSTPSTFVGMYKTEDIPNTPIHLVDQVSLNANNLRRVFISFSSWGSVTANDPILQIGNAASQEYHIFNGVLQYDNTLTLINDNYGYNLSTAQAYPGTPTGLYGGGALAGQKLLSNAPLIQYANIDDYGTFAFLNYMRTQDVGDGIGKINFEFYKADDTLLGSTYLAQPYTVTQIESSNQLMYAGVFPGNLRNWSGMFQGLVTAGTIDGGYYKVSAENKLTTTDSAEYIIHVNCATNLGYTPIRLAWINQWGTWDYYTFTQKSIKSISTNKAPYNQISGNWNKETLAISGYQGGRKNFRVNTSEKIRMNTAYVTEEEGYWFEELINSPEVYIINGYDDTEVTPYQNITNKYVEPVTLTTSSYTRKTIANDKLMQYTIEVEKSKNRRTQSV